MRVTPDFIPPSQVQCVFNIFIGMHYVFSIRKRMTQDKTGENTAEKASDKTPSGIKHWVSPIEQLFIGCLIVL